VTNSRRGLTDEDSGRWLIATIHSEYLIDLDKRIIRRMPGPTTDGIGFEEERLLINIVACCIEERAHFRAAPDSPFDEFESPFDEYVWANSSAVQTITAVDEAPEPNTGVGLT
jgi:hypothetical protein